MFIPRFQFGRPGRTPFTPPVASPLHRGDVGPILSLRFAPGAKWKRASPAARPTSEPFRSRLLSVIAAPGSPRVERCAHSLQEEAERRAGRRRAERTLNRSGEFAQTRRSLGRGRSEGERRKACWDVEKAHRAFEFTAVVKCSGPCLNPTTPCCTRLAQGRLGSRSFFSLAWILPELKRRH